MLRIVQFSLHGWRIDFDDFEIGERRRFLELSAESEDEMVQGGFGGAVVGSAVEGYEGELGGGVGDCCGFVGLGCEVREDGFGEVDGSGVVGLELEVEFLQVDAGRVSEV